MKKSIFILIAMIATLTISAQSTRLDNVSFTSTYVVQQHIDVGQVVQSSFTYTSNIQALPCGAVTGINTAPTSNYTTNLSVTDVPCNYPDAYWQRDVGWNTTVTFNYTQGSINIGKLPERCIQKDYQNVQHYYCFA